MQVEGAANGHMPQLDGLRAVAIAAVMLHHVHYGAVDAFLPLWLGVQLFFVLSGFLITGILLRGEMTVEFVGGFYVRRALRLFPLYYVTVAILAMFYPEVRADWTYYALYGMNLWVVQHMYWGVASHFWSLAVEEQFYLIWPFVVLLLPRRWLLGTCLTLILVAPMVRFSGTLYGNGFFYALLPGAFDALATGSLIAVLGAPRPTPQFSLTVLLVGILLLAIAHNGEPGDSFAISLGLPIFAFFVLGAARGFGGIVGTLLSHPAVRCVGRISYGLYVIHIPVYHLFMARVEYLTGHRSIAALFSIATTFVLAAISWRFLESPINRRRGAICEMIFRSDRTAVT